LDDFDFPFQPPVKKETDHGFGTLEFLPRRESILFIGTPGTGKSHMAMALAFLACKKCHKVFFTPSAVTC